MFNQGPEWSARAVPTYVFSVFPLYASQYGSANEDKEAVLTTWTDLEKKNPWKAKKKKKDFNLCEHPSKKLLPAAAAL